MKIVRYILLVVLTALLAWGVIWAHGQARDQVCRKVDIEVVNASSKPFVTPRGIIEDLKHAHIALEGKPMWQINSDRVERLLDTSPYLESADCIKGQDGHFIIRVRQLVPVMRVMDGDKSYYVNREGKRMEANGNYYCDVPVVNGHFTRAYGPERLVPLLDYVQSDATLNSIVTMYNYRGPGSIYIVPCFVGQIIDFGSVANYENKFKKLLLFYEKVMPVRGWDTYDTISLKWMHQVVATRRLKRVEATVEAGPDDDEIAPDATTITVTDDNRALVRNDGTTRAAIVKSGTDPAARPKKTKRDDSRRREAPEASKPAGKQHAEAASEKHPGKKHTDKQERDSKSTESSKKKKAAQSPAGSTGNKSKKKSTGNEKKK